MGVARRTVRHRPVGVKSYARRDHPVIYVDVRLQIGGNRRTSREFPHKLQPGHRSPPTPPPRRAGPTADREGGDLWHLPWERPGPLTEALARSERAAGWEDPSPARPLDLSGQKLAARHRDHGGSRTAVAAARDPVTALPARRWPPPATRS